MSGGAGIPLAGRIVGDRGRKARLADEDARHLVVGHVVDGRRREHDLGPGPAEALADLSTARIIDDNRQVAKLQADVFRPEQRGRFAGLGPPDLGDFVGGMLGAAAVAGRHRGDGDGTALLFQKGQRAGTLKLDVVRMGMDGQNTRRAGGDCIEFASTGTRSLEACSNDEGSHLMTLCNQSMPFS